MRSFHRHAATQFGTPSAWLRESLGGSQWQGALISDVIDAAIARWVSEGMR